MITTMLTIHSANSEYIIYILAKALYDSIYAKIYSENVVIVINVKPPA